MVATFHDFCLSLFALFANAFSQFQHRSSRFFRRGLDVVRQRRRYARTRKYTSDDTRIHAHRKKIGGKATAKSVEANPFDGRFFQGRSNDSILGVVKIEWAPRRTPAKI